MPRVRRISLICLASLCPLSFSIIIIIIIFFHYHHHHHLFPLSSSSLFAINRSFNVTQCQEREGILRCVYFIGTLKQLVMMIKIPLKAGSIYLTAQTFPHQLHWKLMGLKSQLTSTWWETHSWSWIFYIVFPILIFYLFLASSSSS